MRYPVAVPAAGAPSPPDDRPHIPHARRVGPPRRHLDRLAPQPRGLARKIPAHPLGLRRDRPPSLPRRRRPHPGQRPRRRAPRHRHPQTRRRQPRPHSTSTTGPPTASGSATPAPSSSRIAAARRPRRHQLEVQRLGQIRQLAPRRPDPPPRRQTLQHPRDQARDRTRHTGQTPPPRPRRRLHRHQRRRPPPHHRRVPPLRSPAAQPRPRRRSRHPQHLEQAFHDYLGIDQTLWLHRGCAGDDTHGHVDDITRFVAENTSSPASSPTPPTRTTSPSPKTSTASAPPATSQRQALRDRRTPHARARPLRRPAPPRQLRQLLHRQRARPRPHLQRRATTATPSTSSPPASPPAKSSASTPSTSSGASAPSTASPNRSPHERLAPTTRPGFHQGTRPRRRCRRFYHNPRRSPDEYDAEAEASSRCDRSPRNRGHYDRNRPLATTGAIWRKNFVDDDADVVPSSPGTDRTRPADRPLLRPRSQAPGSRAEQE